MKLTETIEGYAEMSAEEKLKALEGLDAFDEEKWKGIVSKANAEAKKYKDEKKLAEDRLKEKMSEDERAKAEAEELAKKNAEELESLRKQVKLTEMTSQYLSRGFDSDSAVKIANAMYDGDFGKVMEYEKAFSEVQKKKLEQELLRDTGRPQGNGSETHVYTKDEIMAVKDPVARQALIKENLDLFQ